MILLCILILCAVMWYRSTRWERAKSLAGWKYRFDKKVTHKRERHGPRVTDCSGFVTYVLNRDRTEGSWQLVERIDAYRTPQLDESRLRDGTLIAYDSGPMGFDGNRKNGVDHVGIVLKGWDQQLYLCDCKLQHGVRIRPLHEAVVDWNTFALEKKFGEEYMSQFGELTKCFYVGQI